MLGRHFGSVPSCVVQPSQQFVSGDAILSTGNKMLALSSFVCLPHPSCCLWDCLLGPSLSLFPLQLVYGEHWLSVLDFYPCVYLMASLCRAF